jgi:hypothetical protein
VAGEEAMQHQALAVAGKEALQHQPLALAAASSAAAWKSARGRERGARRCHNVAVF